MTDYNTIASLRSSSSPFAGQQTHYHAQQKFRNTIPAINPFSFNNLFEKKKRWEQTGNELQETYKPNPTHASTLRQCQRVWSDTKEKPGTGILPCRCLGALLCSGYGYRRYRVPATGHSWCVSSL